MRVMALDVGDKTIGVAVSDALLLTAQGRSTIQRQNLQQDIGALRQLVEENEVYQIVVGQPLHMDGKESRQSQKVRVFADEIQKQLNIPIVFWDERLTSFAAEQYLEEMGLNWRKRRQHVDKIAAMIILQNYLDSRDHGSGQPARENCWSPLFWCSLLSRRVLECTFAENCVFWGPRLMA